MFSLVIIQYVQKANILSFISNSRCMSFITCMSLTQQLVHFQWQSKVVARVLTFLSLIFCRSFQTVRTCYLSRVCPLPNSQYISSGSQKSLFGFLPSCLSILSLIPNCPYILFITCMSFTQQLVHFQWQSKVVTRVLTFLSLIFFRSYQAVRTCYLSRVCPLSQKLLSGFSVISDYLCYIAYIVPDLSK